MSLINGNNNNFDEVVLKNDKTVLVDFNATWCGPCRMLSPIIEELSEEKKDVDFVSIDCDEEGDLAMEYGVMSIPCLIVFKNGKEVNREVGFRSKEDVESMLGE